MSNPFALIPDLYYVMVGTTLIGWIALIAFPRNSSVNFWFAGFGLPVVLSLFYTVLLGLYWHIVPEGLFSEFLTLSGVYTMFSNQGLQLVGLTDLFTVSLFVGGWMTRKAAQTNMPRLLLYPCLVLTFLLPGVGFAAFAIAASVGGRWNGISEVEQVPPVESQPVAAVPKG